ncbi:MAG: DUF2784 domain-containing protein [Pseudodesulfovibrio sp.]
MSNGQMLLLADAILVVHFCIALYITYSLPVIWLGRIFKWQFVHNLWFRLSHIGLMAVVMLESLIGMLCPLTTWEADLRHAAGGGTGDGQSFVAHWVRKLLFHDFNETTYTIVYALFFSVVVATFFLVPIRLRKSENGKKRSDHSPE